MGRKLDIGAVKMPATEVVPVDSRPVAGRRKGKANRGVVAFDSEIEKNSRYSREAVDMRDTASYRETILVDRVERAVMPVDFGPVVVV